MSLLKKTQLLFGCAILLIACSRNANSNSKNSVDSVAYNEKAPGNLSAEELERYTTAVTAFYDTTLVRHGFNGAILVAKNGRVIFEKYHGYFNLEKKDTLTEHSAFHLASVSKTFTAMAILKLAEQGKLKLDDKVKLYFPNFPYDSITIRMLLSHRSGLPNYLYFMEQLGWDKKQFSDNNDVLNYLIQFQPPLTHQPGSRSVWKPWRRW